jgi:hypothetical protein
MIRPNVVSAHIIDTLIILNKLINIFVEQMKILIVLINIVIVIMAMLLLTLYAFFPVGT